jgi:hypothetical protein
MVGGELLKTPWDVVLVGLNVGCVVVSGVVLCARTLADPREYPCQRHQQLYITL